MNNSLKTDSIWSLIAKFSLPAVVGLVVNAIYNIVDRIFIGKYVGEEALASLMVVFPVLMFIFALSILVGMGGANLISISLGKGRKEDTSKYFTTMVVLNVVIAVIASGLMLVLINPLLAALGAGGTVLESARTYLSIYLVFVPISTTSYCLSSVVRAEGFPKLSMNSMLASAITNIVLDYIFIAVLGLGVAGAAWATAIGQTVGFVILVLHFVRKKSHLHFEKEYMVPQLAITKEIMVIGTPSFLSTLSVSVSVFMLNYSLNIYGGVQAVTAMAAINSLFTFIIMPINGIQGGIQPIIGFNHGAKEHDRVKETLIKALSVAISFSLVAFLVIQFNPEFLLSLFISSESDTMSGAVTGLKIFMAALPVLSIAVMSIGYFQATQKAKVATFLGLLRQFFLLIPLLIILPKYFGLMGVWIAVPTADFISIIVSSILLVIDFRHDKKADAKVVTKNDDDDNDNGELVGATM